MNLAAIHIRAKEAGLDDAAYRDLLLQVAGVTSAKELDEDQYLAVMREIWARIHAKQRRPKITRPKTKTESKIWAVWYEIGKYIPREEWTAPYLMGFVSRVIHREARSTGDLATLTPAEAHKVIESLKQRLDQEEFEYQQKTGVPF